MASKKIPTSPTTCNYTNRDSPSPQGTYGTDSKQLTASQHRNQHLPLADMGPNKMMPADRTFLSRATATRSLKARSTVYQHQPRLFTDTLPRHGCTDHPAMLPPLDPRHDLPEPLLACHLLPIPTYPKPCCLPRNDFGQTNPRTLVAACRCLYLLVDEKYLISSTDKLPLSGADTRQPSLRFHSDM